MNKKSDINVFVEEILNNRQYRNKVYGEYIENNYVFENIFGYIDSDVLKRMIKCSKRNYKNVWKRIFSNLYLVILKGLMKIHFSLRKHKVIAVGEYCAFSSIHVYHFPFDMFFKSVFKPYVISKS